MREKDRALAEKYCEDESEFDSEFLRARQWHIRRLEVGICQLEADIIMTEIMRLLERISDHADNIGISVLRN